MDIIEKLEEGKIIKFGFSEDKEPPLPLDLEMENAIETALEEDMTDGQTKEIYEKALNIKETLPKDGEVLLQGKIYKSNVLLDGFAAHVEGEELPKETFKRAAGIYCIDKQIEDDMVYFFFD